MANQIKKAKLESQIQEIINNLIHFEVKDKIVKTGSVTLVRVTNDLSVAKVYVDSRDRTKTPDVVQHLVKLKGLFRSKIAREISMYKVPELKFVVDDAIDYAQHIDDLIADIKKKEKN